MCFPTTIQMADGVWHAAPLIFDGTDFAKDHGICISQGVVTDMRPMTDISSDAQISRHSSMILLGFFDIQVNGGGGALLNTDPTAETIERLLAAHRALGTTAMLPTVITDQPSVMDAAAEAVMEARDLAGMMGLHIEGPHISAQKRGTHNADHIRPLDQRTIDLVRDLRAESLPVLITVAPEAATPQQVGQLTELGAVVSIGHSNATAEEAGALIDAGATCFTHLFNAMSQMEGRAPGVVGAAISSKAWCSIIADGIHVAPDMLNLAARARPRDDRLIVISDAMPTVGGPTEFDLYGNEVRLTNGRLVNKEGALAGAHLWMLAAVKNLVRFGWSKEAALQAARRNPAQLMGLWPKMGLIGSAADDLIVLTDQLELKQVGLA